MLQVRRSTEKRQQEPRARRGRSIVERNWNLIDDAALNCYRIAFVFFLIYFTLEESFLFSINPQQMELKMVVMVAGEACYVQNAVEESCAN